jgi:hypothetical protein
MLHHQHILSGVMNGPCGAEFTAQQKTEGSPRIATSRRERKTIYPIKKSHA